MPTRMAESPRLRGLEWRLRPLDLLRRWPADCPLIALISGGESARARWSIVTTPAQIVRCDRHEPDPLGLLESTIGERERSAARHQSESPFNGGWIGWLSYDLGRTLEPTAQAPDDAPVRAGEDRVGPLFELMHCPGAYVHDSARDRWFVVGEGAALPDRSALEEESALHAPRLGAFASCTRRSEYQEAVARAVELIRRGDFFQANLAHRLVAAFEGSPRLIAERLLAAAGPWYGAYIESPDDRRGVARTIISASPELFLSLDARSRRVVTRPIKGTRPAGREPDLLASGKDAAELAMIVDLMRNDLGRVCEYGSVRVDEPRSLEAHGGAERDSPQRHGGTSGRPESVSGSLITNPDSCSRVAMAPPPGVVHGVATVSGTLRPGLGLIDLMRAAFPPGSVTGAPKIRAMRVIDEIERVRRGPYCGAIGFFSDCGSSAWNVAIRTAALSCAPGSDAARARGTIDYSVGAGIVEGSDPALEWEETLHKAGILARAFPGCMDGLLNRDDEGADVP